MITIDFEGEEKQVFTTTREALLCISLFFFVIQLALQHIHEGHNYFGVSLPGGQTSFLVVDYDGLQLVDNPTVRPLQPRWDTAWLDHEGESLVSQWQVQGPADPFRHSPWLAFQFSD